MIRRLEELSVFFPTYNEEGNIVRTVESTLKVLPKVAKKWEVIIVNDGSQDNTKEVSQALSKRHKQVRLINHTQNKGYGGALKTGFGNAQYEWIAFADSDGQFDFSEITKFIAHADKADVIVGYRLKRADSLIRKLFTLVWSKILPRVLLGLKVSDYSCGFKMIKKDVYEAVQPLVGEEKVTQIELLTKAQRKGFVFKEVGVHHYPRTAGEATGADIKVVLKSIRDLLRLWRQLR